MANVQKSEIDAAFKHAEQLREKGNVQEALKEYTKVVYFAPMHWPSYFHLGVLFGNTGKDDLALALLKRADAINPKDRVIKNHIADFLIKLNQTEEAIAFLKKSWELDSSEQNIFAIYKIGKALWETNRPAEAIPFFDKVLEVTLTKENASALHYSRWFRALCKMLLGDYLEAWDDYESRFNLPGLIVPALSGEKWLGQSLKGKTIFFAYEQRFGDIIQFVRFLPNVKALGAHIIVQIPPELEKQIRISFPDIELVSTKAAIPAYDYYQFLTSVPAVLKLDKIATVSNSKPYFIVNETDTINSKLPMRNGTKLKVGLVWEGKPDPDRSIPLKSYLPLLKHTEVSFYSFQLGAKTKDLHDHAVGWLVHDLSPKVNNFYDSSVMLKEIDLLITIDTAIAHQAGALGIPVWVMLRHFSDWRWELEREDNLWYPTMRLFRQEKRNDWSKATNNLELAFDTWVSTNLKNK